MLQLDLSGCWDSPRCLHKRAKCGSFERHRRTYNLCSNICDVFIVDTKPRCLAIIED